jgi:cobalt-zinc-cadmium efflux system protein
MTVHLVVNNDLLDNGFLRNVQQHLHDHFRIEHSTIQTETAMGDAECMLDRHTCGRPAVGPEQPDDAARDLR